MGRHFPNKKLNPNKVHHPLTLINIPVREVLLTITQTGSVRKSFSNGQKLCETSRSEINAPLLLFIVLVQSLIKVRVRAKYLEINNFNQNLKTFKL